MGNIESDGAITLNRLKNRLDGLEADRLSDRACPSAQAIRRRADTSIDKGHRQNFQVDADRILHSLSYTRYIDKTQVFYLVDNDHITHRVLHVQLVSKIARTIGRLLELNEDLIEAIALGHDLGHAPFGHDGERYLSNVGRKYGLPDYIHALQSVRALEVLEKKGRGLNLSLQVLDGILCHDGEVDLMGLTPRTNKDFEVFGAELETKEAQPAWPLMPMTMEGCVVRLADTISYVGRDMEDAILLGLIHREDIPSRVVEVLGSSNGTIVYRLVEDLISQSLNRDRIGFSSQVAEALQALKDFNRHRIYYNPDIKAHGDKIEKLFDLMFEGFLNALEDSDKYDGSPVFTDFLNGMAPSYLDQTSNAMKVRDYLASMTDDYFMDQARKLLLPDKVLA